jgi:hypothetical protein
MTTEFKPGTPALQMPDGSKVEVAGQMASDSIWNDETPEDQQKKQRQASLTRIARARVKNARPA